MLVHVDDQTTHQFPEGWTPATGEPLFHADVVIWPLTNGEALWP